MFGAGLGVGMMVFATAEPLCLWGSNPEVLSGDVALIQLKRWNLDIDIPFCITGFMLLNLCRYQPIDYQLRLYTQHAADYWLGINAFIRRAVIDQWLLACGFSAP